MKILAFIKSVLSEADGSGSWSRVGSLLIVIGTLGWVTHVVYHTHTIPDLGGATAFMTAGAGSLYGTNAAKTAVTNIWGKNDTPAPPPQ